jgi:hypothetical protein
MRGASAVTVEDAVALAVYRHEQGARKFTEEPGAAIIDDRVQVQFSSLEETAALKLARKYDLTAASLAAQLEPSALAARAKAKKDADERPLKDAEEATKTIIAADQGQARHAGGRAVGYAAAGSIRYVCAGVGKRGALKTPVGPIAAANFRSPTPAGA